MKIFVIGARGFPNTIGGIEKHCEELYPRLSKKNNIEILVCAFKDDSQNQLSKWKDIKFKYFRTFNSNGFDKLYYAFKSIIYAILVYKPDIIHFQGLNSTLFVPIARLFGIKVITTVHSRDYIYPKWNWIQKRIIKFSEQCSKLSNITITVSEHDYYEYKLQYKNIHLIKNGVDIISNIDFNKKKYLEKYDLLSKKYIFTAARFTKEKDLKIMIKAYNKLETEYPLVIAGDGNTKYAQKIKILAKKNKDIILTGFVSGDELKTLFYNAKIFLLTSVNEVAVPISVLEAMSFKTEVLISDLEVNKILPLEFHNYFNTGDLNDLVKKLKNTLLKTENKKIFENRIEYLQLNHNWDLIANKTYDLYSHLHQIEEKNTL